MQVYGYRTVKPQGQSLRHQAALLFTGLILLLGFGPTVSQAASACASGLYSVGSQCLSDPCESGGTCYYVDSRDGSDSNTGAKAAPWQTMDRVNNAMSGLVAGDYVLFRRDREWDSENVLQARNIAGSEGAPITFGAYGEGARPRVQALRVRNSEYVTLRDFEQVGSQGGPCTAVIESGYVVLQDMHVHDCSNNGLSFLVGTHHSVMIDNRVWDIPSNDSLSIHDSGEGVVGDHHWIVDNVVTGTNAEQPIDISTGNDNQRGALDVKVVGNRVRGGGNGCIALGHGTSMGWIVGNYTSQCTRGNRAFTMGVSGSHGANSGSHFSIVGNVTFSNIMPDLDIFGQDPSVPVVSSHHNTYVHNGVGERPVIRSSNNMDFTMHHNILWPTGSQRHVALHTGASVVTAMNDNWYVEEGIAGCSVLGQTLAEWQASSPHDSRSSCGSIPGMSNPSAADIGNVDVWNTNAFQSHFVPDPSWSGCAAGIGAFDCNGKQHIEFEPFTDFSSDNDGYGWAGPAIVRERYPLGGSQPPATATCDVTFSLPDDQWRLISLPCNPGANSSVAAVFGDDISGAYGDDWALFSYDGSGFAQLDESSDKLHQGVGYWIIQTSGSTVTLDMPANSTDTPVTQSAACIASSNGCFDMPLSTSGTSPWHMVGYPFDSAASLGNVRVMTNAGSCTTGCDLDAALSQDLVHNQIWSYADGEYNKLGTSSNLSPWAGYWLKTLSQAEGSEPRLLTPKP